MKKVKTTTIKVNDTDYNLEIVEKVASWGNGVRVKIHNLEGKFLTAVSYNCHPEFDNYDFYQTMSFSDLTEVAIEKTKNFIDSDNYQTSVTSGIHVLSAINV